MADRIGQADYELRGDQTGLVKDLSAAEAKVSASGARVEKTGGVIGTSFQKAGVVAAIGFGLMTKGALETEEAQGAFRAATGKSEDAARDFTKSMSGIVGSAGTVGKSFAEVSAAGTKVVQQFGLEGKAAADTTDKFFKFAKVTKQDAASAVDDFDGLLDAFGEPAERAGSLMDQLVASNQKFGTDAGPAATNALRLMAPQLQALNLGLDDGVGLLNLFEQSGIDATSGTKALTLAVKNLKPGQDLDDLITQVGAIEDPTLRAKKAMELFGPQAGIKLAQAIKPGMTSLDDYKVSAEGVDGATSTAAENLMTTTEKFQAFSDKLGNIFRDAGSTFGPFVSGLAGIGSLIGPQLGKAWDLAKDNPAYRSAVERVSGAAGSLYDGALNVKDVVADKILDAWSSAKEAGRDAIAAASSFAQDKYQSALDLAQSVKFKLLDAWDASKELAKDAISGAGRVAGEVYSGALALAGKVGSAVGAAFDAVVDFAGPVIKRAAEKAGELYAGAAFVGQRLADAAGLAWDFVSGAAQDAVRRAGGILGKLFGDALDDNIISTTTGAAGTIIGNLTGDLIKAVTTSWDNVRAWLSRGTSGAVIARVGALSGAIYAAAVAVVDKMTGVLGAAWNKMKLTVAPAAAAAGAANAAEYAAGAQGEQTLATGLRGAWAKIGTKTGGVLDAVGGVGAIVGSAFGIAAVAAAGLYIIEHKQEIAGFFKPVGDAVGGLFGPKTTDEWVRDVKSAAGDIQKQFGGDIQVIRQQMQDAFQKGIAAGLDPADAYKYAVELGSKIGTGSADELQDTWVKTLKAHGLDVPPDVAAAAEESGGETGASAGQAGADELIAAWKAANVPDNIAQYLLANATTIDKAGKLMVDPTKQYLVTWANNVGALVGGGVPTALARKIATGSGTVNDGIKAMLMGINLDSSQAALAALYEDLNIPQELALRYATEGPFDLSRALQSVMSDVGHQIPYDLAKSIADQAVAAGLITPQTEAYWLQSMVKVGKTVGEAGGKAVDDGLATSLVAHSGEVTAAADKVRQDLQAALEPDREAAVAAGKKTIQLFRKGIAAENEQTVIDSQQLGLNSLSALEKVIATGKGTQKDAKAVGVYFAGLVASGMDEKSIAVALAADGVASDAIVKLTGYEPDFNDQGKAYDAHLATGIDNASDQIDTAVDDATAPMRNQPAGTWGGNLAAAWKDDLMAVLYKSKSPINAAIRWATAGLQGSSPPKEGPLKTIDKMGGNVMEAWVDAGVDKLRTGAGRFNKVLAGYRLDVGGILPSVAMDYSRLLPSTAGALALAGAPGGDLTVTIGDIYVTGVQGNPQEIGEAVRASLRDEVRTQVYDLHRLSRSLPDSRSGRPAD